MLEVEDIADKWDPPNSDGSCGTQQSEREREEQGKGNKDILRACACQPDLACHVGKYGKK